MIIKDLHPEEWQANIEADHATRTSYMTKDHNHDNQCSHVNAYPKSKRCTFKDEQWKKAKVSYTMSRDFGLTVPTIGMLALNCQTRAEAIPIFYGGIKIQFTSMSAVLPFLRDRSELSIQSMHYIRLDLRVQTMEYIRLDLRVLGIRCQAQISGLLADPPKPRPLDLKKLTIPIYDPYCRYAGKLKLDPKIQRWVHTIAKNTTKFDMLGVTFGFSIFGELTPNEEVEEDSPTQEQVWEFLAPMIMRKNGDELRDAHSLLKCCIRDSGDKEFLDDEVDFQEERAE